MELEWEPGLDVRDVAHVSKGVDPGMEHRRPAKVAEAKGGNPYHDEIGRFTDEGHAVPTGPRDSGDTKNLGGSTGARLVTVNGVPYVEKRGNSPEHVREEQAANDMYRAAGVPVPDTVLIETPKGPFMRAQFVKGQTLANFWATASPEQQAAIMARIQDGFATDALLANWDAVGLVGDNIIVRGDGVPIRVDNGGSLRYRAQGGLKGKAWGSEVTELTSLRTRGTWAPQMFSGITSDRIAQQVADLDARREAILAATPADLRDTVSARLDDMRAQVTLGYRESTGADFTEAFPAPGAQPGVPGPSPVVMPTPEQAAKGAAQNAVAQQAPLTGVVLGPAEDPNNLGPDDPVDWYIDIDFPPIVQKDIGAYVTALKGLYEMLPMANPESQKLVVSMALGALGNNDVDQIMDRIFPGGVKLVNPNPMLDPGAMGGLLGPGGAGGGRPPGPMGGFPRLPSPQMPFTESAQALTPVRVRRVLEAVVQTREALERAGFDDADPSARD